jgi:hypothetical protein
LSDLGDAQARFEHAVSAWSRTLFDGAAYVGQLGAKHLGQTIELVIAPPGQKGAAQVIPHTADPVPFRGVLREIHHEQVNDRNMTRLKIISGAQIVTLDCTPNVEVRIER